MVLPADQLVRHGDPYDVEDAPAAAQVERLELVHVPDESDDRPGHPPADEGVTTRRAHQADDGVDILLRGPWGHHHHHEGFLPLSGRHRPAGCGWTRHRRTPAPPCAGPDAGTRTDRPAATARPRTPGTDPGAHPPANSGRAAAARQLPCCSMEFAAFDIAVNHSTRPRRTVQPRNVDRGTACPSRTPPAPVPAHPFPLPASYPARRQSRWAPSPHPSRPVSSTVSGSSRVARSVRRCTPSFRYARVRCCSTVLIVMNSAAAICRLV